MTDPRPASVAFVAVGSNIDPEKNILRALDLLTRSVNVTDSSTFYRTTAIGRPDQPDFINGVLLLKTSLPPERLKYDVLRNVENHLSRTRTEDKFAPRTIDLDLLLYNDTTAETPHLTLPHPDLQRPFIHTPTLELLHIVATENPTLAASIKILLPTSPPSDEPGQKLTDFTTLIRQTIHSPKAHN